MRKPILIFIIMLILTGAVFAETLVRKVKFTGEKPPSNIIVYNRAGKIFVPDSLIADSLSIVSYYKKQGWFDCEVEYGHTIKTNGAEIQFQVFKNKLYSLNISLLGSHLDSSTSNGLKSIMEYYNGRAATSTRLGKLADDVIDYYAGLGYPYCEVRFNDISIEPPDIYSLSLDIQPGPEVEIEQVVFEGRKNLEPGFLLLYSGLNVPLQYSADKLNLAQKRLSRAGFISDINAYELRYRSRPERGVIVFPIKEASPLLLDGAAGYASKDDNFYGRFNATISNILGKGRQVNIEWAKKDKESRWLLIGYTEPYPFGLPFNLELDFYQDDRDSTFIENGGSVSLQYLASEIYSYGVTLGASRLDPEPYGRTFLPYKNKLKLAVSFSADTRDYPLNPATGDYLLLKAEFISETTKQDSLFPASTDDYRIAEIKVEKYLHPGGSSVLFGGLYAKGDFSENVPVDRLFALGGFGSLRGYLQDQFYVSRKAVVTLEYRLLTSRQGRAYIFTDGAVYQTPQATGEKSDTEYKAGFGIGLAAAVRLGITTVEIAIPDEGGFSDAKLHFGIKAGF